MSSVLERRALTVLVLLTLLFYWRYWASDRFTVLEKPDYSAQVLPWYEVQARAWNDGIFPMWEPYQWGGQPLFGLMQTGAAFPLNWPLFAAPLENGRIQQRFLHWHRLAMDLLGGLFMFAFVRGLGRSRSAALFAGLGFACVGYASSVEWPQVLNGVVFTPLIFLLLQRTLRTGDFSDALFCGSAAGFSWLSGHPRAPLFIAFAVGGVILTEAFRSEPTRRSRLAILTAVIAFAALLAGALQLLPAWEMGRDSYRWVGLPEGPISFDEKIPYFIDEGLRLNPVHLFAAVIAVGPRAGDPFVGLTGLTLAVIGLSAFWRERWARLPAGIALAALLYSFGPQTWFHGWFYAFVPLAAKARGAAQSLFLWQFGIFALAAFGWDALGERVPRLAERLLSATAATAAAAVLLSLLLGSQATVYHGEFVMFAAITAGLLALTLSAARKQNLPAGSMQLCLLALLLLEGGAAHWLAIAEKGDPLRTGRLAALEEPAPALAWLGDQPRPFRFEKIPDGGALNQGALHGLESVEGYLTAVSANVYKMIERQGPRHGRDLLNTVYTLAQSSTRPGQQQVFSGPDGWNVYRNPDARPRAWVEYSTENLPPEAPPIELCDGLPDVRIEDHGLQSARIRATLACPGYLILADVHAPGWKAAVNGRDVEIHQAYGALRAVRLGSGSSVVEYRYRPASVLWGGVLSGSALLLCVVATITRRRRVIG